jgi:hypothetical protein
MISTIIHYVFFTLVLIMAVYSLTAIYALLRFGQNKTLAATVAIVYLVVCSSLFALAVTSLNKINF